MKFIELDDGVLETRKDVQGYWFSFQQGNGLVLEAVMPTVDAFLPMSGDLRPTADDAARKFDAFASALGVLDVKFQRLSHKPVLADAVAESTVLEASEFPHMKRTQDPSDALVLRAEVGMASGVMTRDCSVAAIIAGDILVSIHMPWRSLAFWFDGDKTPQSTISLVIAHLRDVYGLDPAEMQMVILPGIRSCCSSMNVGPGKYQENNQRYVEAISEWNTIGKVEGDEVFYDIPSVAAGQAASFGLVDSTIVDFCSCCGTVNGEHPFFSAVRNPKDRSSNPYTFWISQG